MTPVINIIHLPEREDRRQSYLTQMNQQVARFRVWYGFRDPISWKGISRSHKQIVQFAKNTNAEYCVIAEDDVLFTSKNSWETFLKNMPLDFDLYLGGISGGNPNKETGVIEDRNFSGLFFYAIHKRFYESFLAADENKNIDRWLSSPVAMEVIEKKIGRLPKYVVCYPMIAICIDGVSDNSGKEVKHEFSMYDKLK